MASPWPCSQDGQRGVPIRFPNCTGQQMGHSGFVQNVKILHLFGEKEDAGGVLTLIRNLDAVTRRWGWSNSVWVNAGYVEVRSPPLNYRFSPHVRGEAHGRSRYLLQASLAFFELKRLLRNENFDVLHAHTRGTLLVGLG